MPSPIKLGMFLQLSLISPIFTKNASIIISAALKQTTVGDLKKVKQLPCILASFSFQIMPED